MILGKSQRRDRPKVKMHSKQQVMKVCTGLNWRPSLDRVLSRQVSLNAGIPLRTEQKLLSQGLSSMVLAT